MSSSDRPVPAATAFILDLAPNGEDCFVGRAPANRERRVYGGQVVAQALVAANATVDARTAHSLHCYFLLPGDPKLPISYQVTRLRDGKSFSTRHIIARQNAAIIFSMTVSYQRDEVGLDHQMAMPQVPMPEELPDPAAILARYGDRLPPPLKGYLTAPGLVEFRIVEVERYLSVGTPPAARAATQNVWIRMAERLPDAPAIQQVGLAYLTDFWVLDTTLVPHGRWLGEADILPASLDHAVWFHRPCRADEWLLFAQDTPSAIAGRGFGRGLIYRQDGTLVASLAQEGVIRVRRSEP